MPKSLEVMSAVLHSLGVEDETLEAFKSEETTIKPEDVVKTVLDTQKALFEQDEDFVKPIESRVRGAILEQKERELIKMNPGLLTEEDRTKLPEKERLKELMKLLAKRVQEKIAAGSSDKDMQSKIDELNAELVRRDELIAAKDEEIEKANQSGESKLTDFQRNQKIESIFNNTLGDKLVTDKELLFPAIRQQVEAKYDIKMESGEIVLYEKGKSTKATKNSKPLTLETAFTEVAEEKKAIKRQPEKPDRPPMHEKGDDRPRKFKLQGETALDKEIADREKAGQTAAA